MLHTISPQDMQEMERAFLDGTRYPSILLMEHAAQAVVNALTRYVPLDSLVLFACGGGNNGGDGCAAARLWVARGGRATVWLLKNPSQMRGDAGINACLLGACGAAMQVVYGEVPPIPQDCAAIVDALYGTGLNRPVEGEALEIVRRINACNLPIVAVDIPSGVDGSTGGVLGEAVRARETIAFHRPKHGHLLFPGRAYAGKLTVADIGILPDWDGAQGYDVLEEEDVRALLPIRPIDGHKGTFGRVLSVAGSEGMAGAACLCAQAALRAGAGLVTAACVFPVLSVLQTVVPCAMAKVVGDGARFGEDAAQELAQMAQGVQALAIGPGLSREEGVWKAIEPLAESDIPKVLDADALNLLARYGGGVGRNTVLTPHPGEMACLCGRSVKDVLSTPIEAAQELAADLDACVLLKGATTVIAQGEDVCLSIAQADGMATGGCGDVLTGVIAGLLAQGMTGMDAARVGAYYHARAGEAAQAALGARAVTATDVLARLRIE